MFLQKSHGLKVRSLCACCTFGSWNLSRNHASMALGSLQLPPGPPDSAPHESPSPGPGVPGAAGTPPRGSCGSPQLSTQNTTGLHPHSLPAVCSIKHGHRASWPAQALAPPPQNQAQEDNKRNPRKAVGGRRGKVRQGLGLGGREWWKEEIFCSIAAQGPPPLMGQGEGQLEGAAQAGAPAQGGPAPPPLLEPCLPSTQLIRAGTEHMEQHGGLRTERGV